MSVDQLSSDEYDLSIMATLTPSPSLKEGMGTQVFNLYEKLKFQGLAVKLLLSSEHQEPEPKHQEQELQHQELYG